MRWMVVVVLLAGPAWGQPCVGLNKICGDPNYPDCCGVLECVRTGSSVNGRCREVSTGESTTTLRPEPTSSTTSSTTTTIERESTTTSTNPDTVRYPSLRATAAQVSFGARAGSGGYRCWEGQFATQPERGAMQGKLLALNAGELARYARRMNLVSILHKIEDKVLTASGTRFFGQEDAYEGRVYPSKLHSWSINLQGAGDIYQEGWYRLRDLHDASLYQAARCAETATPEVLAALNLAIQDGACVDMPIEKADCRDNDERGTEGMIEGFRTFAVSDEERTSLQDVHEMHHMVGLWRCDKTLPPYTGRVQQALIAYENVAGSQPDADASRQHFSRIPDFTGYADTWVNRHPLDPDDPDLYWLPADECDWGKMEDQAMDLWIGCEADGGPWGKCQMFGRLHEFIHFCLGFNGQYLIEFPPASGVADRDIPKRTCGEYLAAFRVTGQLP